MTECGEEGMHMAQYSPSREDRVCFQVRVRREVRMASNRPSLSASTSRSRKVPDDTPRHAIAHTREQAQYQNKSSTRAAAENVNSRGLRWVRGESCFG